MKLRLLHDWILAEVEPAESTSIGGIVLVSPRPIRTAKVLAVGPGKFSKKGVRKPVQVAVGDRFPFFKASTESKQGQALALYLENNQVLVRESDVLFLLQEDLRVEY